MGLLRKDPKQSSPGDWIGPARRWCSPAGTAGQGDWLRGTLRLTPGSLLWEPDAGVRASPVELGRPTYPEHVPC